MAAYESEMLCIVLDAFTLLHRADWQAHKQAHMLREVSSPADPVAVQLLEPAGQLVTPPPALTILPSIQQLKLGPLLNVQLLHNKCAYRKGNTGFADPRVHS
jgi:hypothetical protein